MLTYSQSTGVLSRDGLQLAHGWSGQHDGKNNPKMQNVRAVGPIPRGFYTIGPWHKHGELPGESGHLGPMVAYLKPDKQNNMMATDGKPRDAFYIHGPSTGPNYGQESMGCIILLRADRVSVKNSGDNRLEVVE